MRTLIFILFISALLVSISFYVPKPFCFFINKERTKKLCFAGEGDVEAKISRGLISNAELRVDPGKSSNTDGYGVMNDNHSVLRFERDIIIKREVSGLGFDLKIFSGVYEMKQYKAEVRISLP